MYEGKAVLAIYTIFRSFDFLIPDGPELIYNYLLTEMDLPCKRNAFIFLTYADQARALEYLSSCMMDSVCNFGDILQLIIVELIQKVCRVSPRTEESLSSAYMALLTPIQTQFGTTRLAAF
jgi:coatomer subunit beta